MKMNTSYYTTTATAGFQQFLFIHNPVTTIESKAKEKNIWAFIDLQNLHKGVQERGWRINWVAFRQHLNNKYGITKAVIFLGFLLEYKWLYKKLEGAGFSLIFRDVKKLSNGTVDGGNIDADLTGYMMDHKNDYDQAVIIADDGDYTNTIKSLKKQNKLKLIISSHPIKYTSELIKRAVGPNEILSIHSMRNQIG